MEESFQNIPLNALTPFPFSARVVVDEEKLFELAETVKTNGVLEPLIVRPSKAEPGKYEVVCGLRRLLAAQKAGVTVIPCVVKEMSDVEAMEAMLVENIERENLTDYEVGRWFKLLMEKYPDKYPNVKVLADRFGYKDHTQVVHLINHYQAIEDLKEKSPSNIVTRVTMLPERIIREIRRAPEDSQPTLVKAYFKSVDEGTPLGARDMAKMVDKLLIKIPSLAEAEKEAQKLEKKVLEKPEAEKPKVEEPTVKTPEHKPPKPEDVEGVVEEERKRRIEEKMQAKSIRKLDNASRIYVLLTHYFPEPLVEYVSKHVDFTPFTEEKAIALFKDFIEAVFIAFTDAWKHEDKLDPLLKQVLAW